MFNLYAIFLTTAPLEFFPPFLRTILATLLSPASISTFLPDASTLTTTLTNIDTGSGVPRGSGSAAAKAKRDPGQEESASLSNSHLSSSLPRENDFRGILYFLCLSVRLRGFVSAFLAVDREWVETKGASLLQALWEFYQARYLLPLPIVFSGVDPVTSSLPAVKSPFRVCMCIYDYSLSLILYYL